LATLESAGRRDVATEKHLVIVCNAYADTRPTRVEAWPGAARPGSVRADPGPSGALWARELEYGACEEYHVDLVTRRLLFAAPGGDTGGEGGHCELRLPGSSPREAKHERDQHAKHIQLPMSHIAVAVTQTQASPPRCMARALPLVHLDKTRLGKFKGEHGAAANAAAGPAAGAATPLPAELAVLDAFTNASSWRAKNRTSEADLLKKHLRPSPLWAKSVIVRLEDKIESESIASEVIGSRTLGLGDTYLVEPKDLHVILEDIRGSHVFDWRDVSFKAGHSYVLVRAGRAGDSMFPQKFLFHASQENAE